MNKVSIAIPARFASQRFPGKILQPILGKPLIQWTYEAARASDADEVVVLTDNETVIQFLQKQNIPYMRTSPDCKSGTERIVSVISSLKGDIVINVQADEPLITPLMIHTVADLLIENSHFDIATLAKPETDQSSAENPNRVKVVLDSGGKALYFSRALIPFPRESGGEWLIHVGIYGYRRTFLEQFPRLDSCRLEEIEKLEQLRFLYNGFQIGVAVGDYEIHGVDVPEDVLIVEKKLKERMRNE